MKKDQYADELIEFEIIGDFLPPPEKLILKEYETKNHCPH